MCVSCERYLRSLVYVLCTIFSPLRDWGIMVKQKATLFAFGKCSVQREKSQTTDSMQKSLAITVHANAFSLHVLTGTALCYAVP